MEIEILRLKELLSYDPGTGNFIWLVDRQRARKGGVAGCICPMYGYRYIGIDYRRYRANRLAWFYMTGEWPEHQVDHRDRCRINDKWSNLRLATVKQNQENCSVRPSNISGFKGVRWEADRAKWIAHITHNGRTFNLGRFADLNSAISARREAESSMFTHAT